MGLLVVSLSGQKYEGRPLGCPRLQSRALRVAGLPRRAALAGPQRGGAPGFSVAEVGLGSLGADGGAAARQGSGHGRAPKGEPRAIETDLGR